MSVLSGKKILLGVTGGIAAYKTASLVRLLIKAGAEVQVIMTPASHQFVTPFTLSTLSKKPVYTEFFNAKDSGTWNNHVELALWADIMLIAPATANVLAKMTHGLCDNLLLAVYMSAKCPVYIAPAMDLDMYVHPSTERNLATLSSYNHVIIPAEEGELASGLVGQGRMAEPETIVAVLQDTLRQDLPLQGKKILITAGPTYEPIDPVRFIGNHSSGKMGYDIAKEAAKQGATVILVSGPTNQKIEDSRVQVISVMSASEMYEACHQYFDEVDAVVAAAAVADYRPKEVATQKIKKNAEAFTITLDKNPDILASLGAIKKQQYLIGFALETENEVEHAKQKITKKNLDLIVLNSLNDTGAGFGKPTNKVTFIDRNFVVQPMELKSKEAVAQDIVNKIIQHYE
ncbi:bifunctional phosphopantothenoylcysteine decarboxylase/phosphopantothenate--cysteine ligase CoaBC [Myroides sp. 1354]|uniref:bifunctional phosphopantothenoylcysteine decarboxylase/phosphopantothenate--cysteine ligase CoaBC n=1 Tax=unclassified Myroides TaxID=2642485 RepID=UPI0025750F0B|nr:MULTISPECIES: bifunctional phosphopantothenoylcysteine decarboxylase/phosphopantothenate--cysteine ligase CoaBC [unclassified Myroides]MDM1046575.1 bifunctional phosphopantothenoylcysteine decarboxylase/phosphopantothenate--cysteine ligase CoaBC [Myroides sp. R163-1]MDM1057514.1 bifunctional phosphopantothenoylcysteine decarboxylase/phosphopantothenate--cysteine ligase CoaBC [Myroides sp. 1354]MDM1070796.1 bifunctional phosphopantothenoylcysteine decarboxylase/phosphopantothenate--cysteine li